MLSKMIEALQIFLKYGDVNYPTHCEHDVLTVCVDPAKVSDDDKAKLDKLGFFVDETEDCFKSYRYGCRPLHYTLIAIAEQIQADMPVYSGVQG